MDEQRRLRRRRKTVPAVFTLLILFVFFVSMNTGYMKLAPADVLRTLFGEGTDQQELILFDFRMPRMVLSVLVGAGLAVSGCILQSLSRNALADPGILGINAGAGVMVMLFVSFFPSGASGSVFLLPLLAWTGAGMTAAFIYILSYKRNQGITPSRLLLSGIGVAAGISAATVILTIRLDPMQYQFVATWLAGSIWGTTWMFVLALLPWIVLLLPYAWMKARVLNVLQLGEPIATGLGAPVQKEQLKLLAAAVGLAASCVSVSGSIGFVGLIGPHLARRLVGPRHQILVPVAALAGAFLVITADTIGRWVMQPYEIPAGTVVAVIGAPYFIYLLVRSNP